MWIRDRPTAGEEIVRWATPVVHFRRTASRDTEIGGQPIAEGDKVVMWYESANRDERRIDDPFRFDIRRDPNEHVGAAHNSLTGIFLQLGHPDHMFLRRESGQ